MISIKKFYTDVNFEFIYHLKCIIFYSFINKGMEKFIDVYASINLPCTHIVYEFTAVIIYD